MRAMVMRRPGEPLALEERALPDPSPGQLRLRVEACGVCRTDLHVFDGDLAEPRLPLILGHEIVGRIDEVGPGVEEIEPGARVGVPWLGWTCGDCPFCRRGQENLCDRARFTGYQLDGGYAEATLADPRYCFPVEEELDAAATAPLLCAGLIGYRSLRMAGDARRLGLYGFGAAAHIVAQIARWEGREVYAFTRAGDTDGQAFARELGAVWAGGSDRPPPERLDAAILFAPVGGLVPRALAAVRKGGVVICAGIHMSDVPAFPYELLWGERSVRSVANLTRQDGLDLFEVAPRVPVRTQVTPLPLSQAGEALRRLRQGEVRGALVLTP
ncbi:MAG: zinc-dependent alcohol dehydrogenase family protein [Thermoanaerobaculia bacterium]|nr:zinc-dependent alcohol dehydrogenase family protein [Thermoanaerobaculia bacterium]